MDLSGLWVGLLPKWNLFIGVVSFTMGVANYISEEPAKIVYTGVSRPKVLSPAQVHPAAASPVSGLSARTFGTWNIMSAVARLYAAFYPNNPQVYEIVFASYGIALGHFILELLVYRTTTFEAGLIRPLLVASTGVIWMWSQWSFYVQ